MPCYVNYCHTLGTPGNVPHLRGLPEDLGRVIGEIVRGGRGREGVEEGKRRSGKGGEKSAENGRGEKCSGVETEETLGMYVCMYIYYSGYISQVLNLVNFENFEVFVMKFLTNRQTDN